MYQGMTVVHTDHDLVGHKAHGVRTVADQGVFVRICHRLTAGTQEYGLCIYDPHCGIEARTTCRSSREGQDFA